MVAVVCQARCGRFDGHYHLGIDALYLHATRGRSALTFDSSRRPQRLSHIGSSTIN